MFDAGEKFVSAREAKFERGGFTSEFRGKVNLPGGDDDGAASGAELFREFAQSATDFVVFAVAGKVF